MHPQHAHDLSQTRQPAQVLRSYTYVVLWMSISISVILFNKWLLAFSGFPYPIALTSWHMLFCSTIGFLCVRVFKVVKSHNMTAHTYTRRVLPIGEGGAWHFATFCTSYHIVCSVANLTDYTAQLTFPSPPAGLLYAASLWLSNASYLYLSVSFIQMTKSLMPGLVYASGVLLGTEKFSSSVSAAGSDPSFVRLAVWQT